MAKNYGRLARDDNRIPISTASAFVTADVTATPKTSPLTVSSTEVVISVPTNAVEMVITDVDNDLRVSEVTGMAQYFVCLAANTAPVHIPVAGMDTIYLKRNGGSDAVTQFYFATV